MLSGRDVGKFELSRAFHQDFEPVPVDKDAEVHF
jgi:hypothetical protein